MLCPLLSPPSRRVNRRGFCFSGLALCLACVSTLATAATPNIVLITADDQDWRDFSFTGTSGVLDTSGNPVRPYTPTIDTLFENGVTYSMGHCPVGVCRPSLTSIFTGLNPMQSGTYGNDPVVNGTAYGWGQNQDTIYNDVMRRNVELNPTLPRLLAEKGYVSLQTGKWWEGDPKRAGFTNAETGYETTNADRHLHNYTDNGANSIGRFAGSVASRIGPFVDSAVAANKPFFISYAPMLPHLPHDTTPTSFKSRYQGLVDQGKITTYQRDYLACVDWFDSTIGEVRTLLQNKGVDNNTLYVFLADNGWLQTTGSAGPFGADGGKLTSKEDGVRTPIIFYQNGQITDSRSVAAKLADARLASSTDIMPTLLSLVGATVPKSPVGRCSRL